jgi:hypothetical protein
MGRERAANRQPLQDQCRGPDLGSWERVAAAMDAPWPTPKRSLLRRCDMRGERIVVRDGDFACGICDAALPLA